MREIEGNVTIKSNEKQFAWICIPTVQTIVLGICFLEVIRGRTFLPQMERNWARLSTKYVQNTFSTFRSTHASHISQYAKCETNQSVPTIVYMPFRKYLEIQ
jgi:hypothetical protein